MKNNFVQIIVIAIVIMVVQVFIPSFRFYDLDIAPDILIIFLTYIGFYYDRFYVIILGFLVGFTQDFITQVELLGAMAFTKSAIAFGLGTLSLYRSIWSKKIRLFFIFFIYCLHFSIFHFIKFNGVPISIFLYIQLICMHSLLSFSILFIFDRSFVKHGITHNDHFR